MPRRTSWAGSPCPIARALDVVGEPWTLLILRDALSGTTRFDQFRDALGVADNVLSARLARLVDAGLLVKVPYRDARRTRHEYRITRAAADLLPVLDSLARWGQAHTEARPGASPMRLVHLSCGGATRVGEHCDHCGEGVERADLAWDVPWLSVEPIRLAEPAG